MKYITVIGEREYQVEIIGDDQIEINGKRYSVDFDSICDQPVYSLLLDGKSYEAYVYPAELEWQVLLDGHSYQASVEEEFQRRMRGPAAVVEGSGEFHLKSPMPGLVVAVAVEEGQAISKGQVLVILESMKMQNELKSPRDGTVARLRVKAGDSVEQHQPLLSVL